MMLKKSAINIKYISNYKKLFKTITVTPRLVTHVMTKNVPLVIVRIWDHCFFCSGYPYWLIKFNC